MRDQVSSRGGRTGMPLRGVIVAVSSLNLATSGDRPIDPGVYRVLENGTSERLPGTGAMLFPNDVTLDKRGSVYATDTSGGAVWRISRRGSARSGRTIPCSRGAAHSDSASRSEPTESLSATTRSSWRTPSAARWSRSPPSRTAAQEHRRCLPSRPPLLGLMGSLSMSTATSTRALGCRTESFGSPIQALNRKMTCAGTPSGSSTDDRAEGLLAELEGGPDGNHRWA
jgi:hypothetical protein